MITYIHKLGISKNLFVGMDHLPCGFVSLDNYWAHSGSLKNPITFTVSLHGRIDFQPTAQVRATSTNGIFHPWDCLENFSMGEEPFHFSR